MTHILALRPDQQTAIDAVREAWARGVARPAVVAPTGWGKTVAFAHLVKDDPWGQRSVILVHREELVTQTLKKLHSIAPGLPAGVVKAGRNDVDADVIVGSVQTLRRSERRNQIKNVGCVIVDECHHATAESYLDVLDGFRCFTGAAVAAGFTATMRRSDNTALGEVWQEIVHERDIIWGIRNGYLCDVTGIAATIEDFDMSSVRSTGGDYRDGDLGRAFLESHALEVIRKMYREHAAERKAIIFTPTVETAQLTAGALSDDGHSVAAIWGAMPGDDRRQALKDFASGKLRALVSCMVLTEGFDEPSADVAIIARPTQSPSLWIQMIGRVLRLYPGKKSALVIDISGASAKHALVGINTLAGGLVKDQETLLDAVDRIEEEEASASDGLTMHPKRLKASVSGDREVDLFHGARQQWLTTPAGFWFVSISERYISILPSVTVLGAWDVAWWPAPAKGKPAVGKGGWLERGIEDIGYAQAWGERAAEEYGHGFSNRSAAWRKKRASESQRALAVRLGVEFSEDVRSGELSNRIDQVIGGKFIDAKILPYLKSNGVEWR